MEAAVKPEGGEDVSLGKLIPQQRSHPPDTAHGATEPSAVEATVLEKPTSRR